MVGNKILGGAFTSFLKFNSNNTLYSPLGSVDWKAAMTVLIMLNIYIYILLQWFRIDQFVAFVVDDLTILWPQTPVSGLFITTQSSHIVPVPCTHFIFAHRQPFVLKVEPLDCAFPPSASLSSHYSAPLLSLIILLFEGRWAQSWVASTSYFVINLSVTPESLAQCCIPGN